MSVHDPNPLQVLKAYARASAPLGNMPLGVVRSIMLANNHVLAPAIVENCRGGWSANDHPGIQR